MPRPLQVLRILGIAGDHEGIGIVSLPNVYSSEDSVNIRFDKLGQIRKIAGYTAQNSAVTTDTGGSATACTGLAQYKSMSGGATTRHVVGYFDDGTNEAEIHVSTDDAATFSFAKQISTTAGLIPDFAQYGNDLFMTFGEGNVQVYDGSTVSDAGGTQSPTPTLTESATVGLPSGNYQCKIVSMVGNTRQIGSAASSTVQLDSKQGSVSWTADSNGSVTGYELYFTTGTGNVFYFAGYVDGRTTVSFDYALSDAELLQNRRLEEHGDAPPSAAYFCEAHKQAIWFGRTDEFPRRLWHSDPGDADSVGSFSYLDLSDETNGTDQLQGMTGNYNRTLIGWLEYGVYRVTGSGVVANNLADWRIERTNASAGTVSHRSVVRVPAGATYVDENGAPQRTTGVTLAYFSPYMKVHLFNGENDVVISAPKTDFLASVQYQYRHLVWAELDQENQEITWYVPHGSSQTTCNKGIRWNYRFGTWTEIDTAPFAHGCVLEKTNDAQTLLVGEATTATGGLVYENKTGTDYNGTGNDISADFWTKPLVGVDPQTGEPAPELTKLWRWVIPVMVAQSSSQDLTIRWYADYANSGATAAGTATLDMSLSNATHKQAKALLKNTSTGHYVHSESLRLRLGDSADDAAWGIAAILVGYKTKPGIRVQAA